MDCTGSRIIGAASSSNTASRSNIIDAMSAFKARAQRGRDREVDRAEDAVVISNIDLPTGQGLEGANVRDVHVVGNSATRWS